MKNDKKLTLSEHIENADDLAIATHHLQKIFQRTQIHYPNSSKLMKALYKILPGSSDCIISKVQHLLDEEYHELVSNEVFEKHGHVYYKLEERYKNITS